MKYLNFEQSTPAQVWTISHSFEELSVSDVWVLNNGNIEKILPLNVTSPDNNTIEITFSQAMSGGARLATHSFDAGAITYVGEYGTVTNFENVLSSNGAPFGMLFRVPITETTPVTLTSTGYFRVTVDSVTTLITVPAVSAQPFSTVMSSIQSQLPADFEVRVVPLPIMTRYETVFVIERMNTTFSLQDGDATGSSGVFNFGLFYTDIDNNADLVSPLGQDLAVVSRTAPSSNFTINPNPGVVNGDVTFTPTTNNAFVYRWLKEDGFGSYILPPTDGVNIEGYSAAGTKTMTLMIANAYGEATSSQNFEVSIGGSV